MNNPHIRVKDSSGNNVNQKSYLITNDNLTINSGINSIIVETNELNRNIFSIHVNNNSTVNVTNNYRIFAGTDATICGNNNLEVSGGKNSNIDVCSGNEIIAGNNSNIKSVYNNHIKVGDFSKVVTKEYSRVQTGEYSSVTCTDNCHIDVDMFSSVECYGKSTIDVSYKTILYLRNSFRIESLLPSGIFKLGTDRLYFGDDEIRFMVGEEISIKDDHIIFRGMEISFDDYNSLALMKMI